MKTVLRHKRQIWQDLQCRPVLQQYLLMALQDGFSSYGNCRREQGLMYKWRKRRLFICLLLLCMGSGSILPRPSWTHPGTWEHFHREQLWNTVADVVLIRSCSNICKLLSSIDSNTLGNRKWDMVASSVQLVKQVSACSYTFTQAWTE